MKTLLRIGLTMLVLAVVLTGVSFGVLRAQVVGDGDYRHGDRTMASETRKVGDGIVAIDMNGSVDLILKQGATPNMVVHAEQRMLPHIKTVQQGNTLRIDVEGMMFHFNRPQRVELTLPALQQLDMHGSGDSIVNGFSGDKLTLGTHGSGDIHFEGQYQHVKAGAFGSGDVQLALSNATDVDLDLHGSRRYLHQRPKQKPDCASARFGRPGCRKIAGRHRQDRPTRFRRCQRTRQAIDRSRYKRQRRPGSAR